MGFDRSKFAAVKVDNLKKQDEDFEKKNEFKKKSGRSGFVKLEEGKNKLRIYPAHPGTKTFMQPCTTHWLEVESKWTDKDGNEKAELKRKPIFSGKNHSKLGKCPIDTYIMHVYKIANEEYQDKRERDKFTSPLKGKNGITGNTKWIAYADLKGSFGRIELPTSVKNAMNDIAFGQDVEDGVIVTDPFTDPDTGRCIYVTKNSQEDVPREKREASKYYSTAIDINKVTPLSDEELGQLLDQPSLEELYVGVYSKRDFDLAVDGLKRFDEKNNFGVFSVDEFLDTLEEIYEKLPEAKSNDDKSEAKAPKKVKEEVKEDVQEDSDLPFDVDIMDMDKDALKGVIRRNELPIRSIERVDIQEAREWVKEEMEIKEGEQLAKAKEEKEEEQESKPSRRRGGSRLSAISEELNS